MLSSSYEDSNITLKKYSAEYMEYKFYSDKASYISIDDKKNIIFDEFWVYDNILVKGIVQPSEKSARLDIHSDRFNYLAEDINISAKVDAQAVFDKNITQKVDANVTLMGGFLSYVPQNDYKITDKDIIIVQDIKPEDSFPLALNVNVNTQKPIRYKTKEIDVEFIPKLSLVQDINQSYKLLGQVTIVNGTLTTTGKEFKIDESYIYFEGEEELNPKINLHLHYYTLDYIDIEIFITNTLNEPVLIFSSKPAMSQNDIMSYILFGEPASSLFDNSQGGNKTSINALLLGAGLKQMLNETSGVNVDTLNILNNTDGTLGYEVGARFNKNIRVVYKSDTASSIVLQYSITQSIRFDIDSHETGQGVAFTYVKDFTIR
jgi:translocation and assembly module TamB